MTKSPRARVAAVFADVLASLQLSKDRVLLLQEGTANTDAALIAALATVTGSFNDLLANVIGVMNNIASGKEPDAGLTEPPTTSAGSQETLVEAVIAVMCERGEDAGVDDDSRPAHLVNPPNGVSV